MATRIEIELTSRRDDDTFTWRAAGAREPRGVADVSLFPAGSSVGEQFKVEADVDLDGITVTNVLPKEEKKRSAFDTLELLSREDEPLVTQQLAEKGRRGDRRDRGERRGGRDKRRGGGDRERDRDERRPRSGDQRPRTPPKPKLPPKPKPPRLKAGRVHRDELLASLPEEQKPVAQELLRGGLQAVRTALAKQNEQQRKEGAPEIDEGPILALAEELLVRVRTAEWRDRAEAALEQAEVVDLRDLRTVVTAADGMGRDEETRALGSKLRTALNERLDAEHNAWVDEIIELLDDDRVVRALHLSSRPPKAGAPLPAPVAMRLVEAANAAMTSEITPDRWSYILEALAHSPVRRQVVPASLPANVTPELKATIARFGLQLPEIAQIFGIEPDPRAGRGGERRRRRPKGRKGGDDQKAGGSKAGDGQKAGAPRDGDGQKAGGSRDGDDHEAGRPEPGEPTAGPSGGGDRQGEESTTEGAAGEEPTTERPPADEPRAGEATPAEPAANSEGGAPAAPAPEASQGVASEAAEPATDSEGGAPEASQDVASEAPEPAEPEHAPMADAASAEAEGTAGDQVSASEGPTERPAAPSDVEADARADGPTEAETEAEPDSENRVPAGGPPAEGDPTDATTPPPGGGIATDEPSAEG